MGKTFSTGLLTNGIWQDASNNIGIGGSPSGSYKLEVTGTSRVSGNLQLGSTTASSTTTPITLNMGGTYGTTLLNGIKIKMFDDGTTVHGLGVIAGNLYLNATDGATKITLNTNNTERMTITSAGNVGIGVTPATFDTIGPVLQMGRAVFYGYNNEAALGANFRYEGGDKYINSDFACLYQMKSGTHVFLTAPSGTAGAAMTLTERMRITSGGALNYNIASNTDVADLYHPGITLSNINGGTLYQATNTTANVIITRFANPNGNVGSITTSGVSTSYNPSSDRRLKENIKPIENAIEKVLKLKPVTYTWIKTGESDDGFIAQDLLEIDYFKHRVNPIGEAEDGTDLYGVDYMRFVSILTAAIQEQQIQIQELSAQNQDLKSRLDKAGL
jgi:hypothetical protein